MSPGKKRAMDKAAKGYEKDKKDKSARDVSERVVKDLYPGIAAGQVASLRAAGVIDEGQEKKVLKEFIAGHNGSPEHLGLRGRCRAGRATTGALVPCRGSRATTDR